MKLNLKERDKAILIGLLGVALFFVGYYVFMTYGDKKEIIEQENVVLSQEVEYLQTLMDNKDEYLAKTESMSLEIEEIKGKFPASIYPEDEIYYTYTSENVFDVYATRLTMPSAEMIAVAQATTPVAEPEAVDDGTEPVEGEGESAEGTAVDTASTVTSAASSITLYKSTASYEMEVTYKGIKEWVKSIVEDMDNKKSISNLSLTYNKKTGNLDGKMDVNMFALTGTERTYESPSIPGIGIGTDDLFKASDTLNTSKENNTFDANAEGSEATENGEDTKAEE